MSTKNVNNITPSNDNKKTKKLVWLLSLFLLLPLISFVISIAISFSTATPMNKKSLDTSKMYYYPTDESGDVYYKQGSEQDIDKDYIIYNNENYLILENDFEQTDYIQENFYWNSYNAAKSGYSNVSNFILQSYDISLTLDQYNSLLNGETITIFNDSGDIHQMDINMYLLNNNSNVRSQYTNLENSLNRIPYDYLDIVVEIIDSDTTNYRFNGIKEQYRCTSDSNNPLKDYNALILPSYVNKIDGVNIRINEDGSTLELSTSLCMVGFTASLEPVVTPYYYLPTNIRNFYSLSNEESIKFCNYSLSNSAIEFLSSANEASEFTFDNFFYNTNNCEFYDYSGDFSVYIELFLEYAEQTHEIVYNIIRHNQSLNEDIARKFFRPFNAVNL